MKNLFKIWHGGGDFTDPSSSLSSRSGILSYRGVAVAFCYKSELMGIRQIVSTEDGEKLIRLNREWLLVSQETLRHFINLHLEGRIDELSNSLINHGCPPVKMSISILVKYSDMPSNAPFPKEPSQFTKRYIVLSKRKISADINAHCLAAPKQQFNASYYWYILDDPLEVSLMVLGGHDLKVIDLKKVKQAIRVDLTKNLSDIRQHTS